MIQTSLTIAVILASISALSFASAAVIDPLDKWNTGYGVGQFLYTDKPDQVFKIYYRAINATLDRFSIGQGSISAHISGSNNGTLEVMFPLNYPSTNVPNQTSPDTPVIFVNDVDKAVDSSNLRMNDCFEIITIPVNSSSKVELAWTYYPSNFPFHGYNVPNTCLSQTVVPDIPIKHDGSIGPLQQIKAGISPTDVACPNKELAPPKYFLFLSTNGKPYCVKPSSMAIVKQKGWTLASSLNLAISQSNKVSCQVGQLCSYPLITNSSSYQIPFKFYGEIQNMTLDRRNLAMEISINPLDSGKLEIAVPKELVDSTTPLHKDDHFTVTVDSSVITNFNEYPSDKDSQWAKELGISSNYPEKYRILEIPVKVSSTSVWIIGAHPY